MSTLYIITVIIIPVTLIPLGLVLWRHPPRINGLYGYRTRRSMRSTEMWREAQPYAGRMLALAGMTGLALAALVHLSMGSGAAAILVAISLQTLALLGIVPLTERHLSRWDSGVEDKAKD